MNGVPSGLEDMIRWSADLWQCAQPPSGVAASLPPPFAPSSCPLLAPAFTQQVTNMPSTHSHTLATSKIANYTRLACSK